jgi:uncharacterized membrane protein YbhN (UPF0104 family)
MRRSSALRLARTLVAVAFVAFLGWKAGLADLTDISLQPLPLVLALPVAVGSVAVRAYNHALLLNRPVRVVGAWDAFLLTLAGVGINLFLPTGAADLAKARWGLTRHGNAEAMVVSSVLDKLTSLTAVAFMGAVGAAISGMGALSMVAAGLVVLTLLPLLAPRVVPWHLLLRILAPGHGSDAEIVRGVSNPPWLLLAWVYCVSVFGWLCTYAVIWLCCMSAGADPTPAQLLAVAPVSSIARLVPVSLGGVGLGEATLAALLAGVGVPFELAARGVLLSMVLLVFAPGAAGLLVIARGRRETPGASSPARGTQDD